MEQALALLQGLPLPHVISGLAVVLLLVAVLVRAASSVPTIDVSLDAGEDAPHMPAHRLQQRPPNLAACPVEDVHGGKYDPKKAPKGSIPCYDPGSLELLGYVPAMTAAQVGGRPPQRSGPAWPGPGIQ